MFMSCAAVLYCFLLCSALLYANPFHSDLLCSTLIYRAISLLLLVVTILILSLSLSLSMLLTTLIRLYAGQIEEMFHQHMADECFKKADKLLKDVGTSQ